MKSIYLLIGLLFCCITGITAQKVSYGYDAAGNRISRVIVFSQLRTANDTIQEEPKVYSEMLQELEIRIYPNPVKTELTIAVTAYEENFKGECILYDTTGKMLVRKSISSEITLIEMGNYIRGNYVLHIVLNEKTTVWKVIKE